MISISSCLIMLAFMLCSFALGALIGISSTKQGSIKYGYFTFDRKIYIVREDKDGKWVVHNE